MAVTKFTAIVHWATVGLMAAAVLAATGVGFAQSWAGLYGWAIEHRLTEWKAVTFPAMVDLFIAVGELGLFKLAIEGHHLRKALLPWLDLFLPLIVAVAGWVASLLFNIGHVGGTTNDKVTAAVPPIASMLGLFVLLSALHRLVTRAGEPSETAESTSPEDAELIALIAEGFADDTEPGDPAQRLRDGIASLMVSAKASGLSYDVIAASVPTNTYQAKKLIKPLLTPAEPPALDSASANGHHPTGDDQ